MTTANMIKSNKNIFTTFIKDIFLGWTIKESIFAWSLIFLQIITFVFNPDSITGFITGLTGTICVLLVAKRKMSNYVFGFIQTGIALYLGLSVRLWGESIENAFYFISQIWGFMAWRNHMIAGERIPEEEQVETRCFGIKEWVISLTSIAIGTYLAGTIFSLWHGTQPFIDSFTLAVSIVAQIIMIKRFREQWNFWFILNVVSLYQWFTLGNMSMVALYIAFIINNAYGYYEWTKGASK